MEIENKLDEDFLFYLGFTRQFSEKVKSDVHKNFCQLWLQKLCGEAFPTIEAKRNRNILLSNLILHMLEGTLNSPFDQKPENVDLNDAAQGFYPLNPDISTPKWLEDIVNVEDEEPGRDEGRTYVATRVMPDNRGAFAYVAISMDEEQSPFLGGGEEIFNRKMQMKYEEMCPVPTEMEQILARRKDVKERQRVLTFYDVILQNIADELDEKISFTENGAVTILLDQLVEDLKTKGQYAEFESLSENERRSELLIILYDKTKVRRDKVAKREEILDDIQDSIRMPASFFDTSVLKEDKYEMPTQMWEFIINRPPNKKNIELLEKCYPKKVVEIFLQLLSDQKETIAIRMQKRHCNIVSQMKKELRKESEKLKKWVDEIKNSCEQTCKVRKAIVEAHNKKHQSEEKARRERKVGGETALTGLYNELRNALYDAQELVEYEAERGRVLSQKINAVNNDSELYHQLTDANIMQAEEINIDLMKGIKKLQVAVQHNENRLNQLRKMKDQKLKAQDKQSQQMFFF